MCNVWVFIARANVSSPLSACRAKVVARAPPMPAGGARRGGPVPPPRSLLGAAIARARARGSKRRRAKSYAAEKCLRSFLLECEGSVANFAGARGEYAGPA
ncbi:uncharacterized protein Tco025E_02055 [Trypanosoma conorhini]|uniref:Uncharacterized protein n=1 Tax=Trypanosoma conorhini TaxID=83891 RepID=A0A3R7NYF7_9TRYP|nr:uncharacterized protein Tco025E_02055 [Trypanosoma conorhini]RNF25800.1 hypothetical protein Tco025E_02055 [Trypanosoma conorhini]